MHGRAGATRWLLAGWTPFLLAGLLELDSDRAERWPWAGSWLYPVGDSCSFPSAGVEGYRINRNLSIGPDPHFGADLSNRRSGGTVRVAAHGLVVLAGPGSDRLGYGYHVVLAHRLVDGTLAYSVYAHLVPGSIAVRAGQPAYAGQVLGRVGMSGRATSSHLHFEVRLAHRPEDRWEHARAVDPLAFVAARLPAQRRDSTWARPYLLWAEAAALIGPEAEGTGLLRRGDWWQLLSAALRHEETPQGSDLHAPRRLLERCGVLEADSMANPSDGMSWSELVRDLENARDRGLRLPPSPVTRQDRADACRSHLGIASASSQLRELGRRRVDRPSVAEACLVLADLVGEAPRDAPDLASHHTD